MLWIVAIVAFLLWKGSTVFAVKAGALVSNRPEMEYARRVAAMVYASYGYTLTITSGEETGSTHKSRSLHYEGLAEDYRTRDVKAADLKLIVSTIRSVLGTNYDVILETDHLHVEYDPKVTL